MSPSFRTAEEQGDEDRSVEGNSGEGDSGVDAEVEVLRNAKQVEGNQHPDRDGQFGYPNDQAQQHWAGGCPL